MRIVQVGFFIDPQRRDPAALLDAWSGLTVPAEAAAQAGLDVTVVQACAVDQTLHRGDVTYHFVADRRPSALRRRLGRWAAPLTPLVVERVAVLEPRVVHVHGLSYPRHSAQLMRRLPRTPVLLQDHADRPPPRWRTGLYRESLGGVAGVLFTAAEQAEPFYAAAALARDVPVFEVLESTTRFTPAPHADGRTMVGVDGDPCFVWVGRLDENKDPLTVLDAFARAADDLPRAKLWMCYADAPLLGEVRGRIQREPKLAGRVTLLGTLSPSDLQRLLRAADFLVLGSHREGSGYAVIEALACGTTPLVTDIPSFRKITGDGAFGALSRPGDVAQMAESMTSWAKKNGPELRESARAHFERHLSIGAIGVQLRFAYEGVSRASRARSAPSASA